MTREEAIKNIKEHCYFANLIPRAKEALDMAIKALEQEPKTGHWIKIKDQYGNFHYECSKCGNDIATQTDYSGDNYCLECGCRMVEPQESEDKE